MHKDQVDQVFFLTLPPFLGSFPQCSRMLSQGSGREQPSHQVSHLKRPEGRDSLPMYGQGEGSKRGMMGHAEASNHRKPVAVPRVAKSVTEARWELEPWRRDYSGKTT